MRFGAFFIGLCMAIIATSLGAVMYLTVGLSAIEAVACGVTALSIFTAYNAFAGRNRDRAELNGRITDLSRGTADLARQVGELGRRVIATEAAVTQTAERTRTTTDPLAVEIEVLGTLVKQLAESLAAHEMVLFGPAATAAPPLAPGTAVRGEYEPQAAFDALGASDPEPRPALPAGGDMQRVIRAALESNRVDLYLQPIVTLPQRKVRFYEAMTRLRTEDGDLLLPSDYLSPAENGGLMPLLDNLMLFRSVQVVRRLSLKSREAGLFCNISSATLADSEFFPQFFEFLSANRALSSSLLFEFGQAALRAMGPVEHESLAQLAELGFRFSMDRVQDLQIEPRPLAEQGFRFVKVPAPLLLSRTVANAADIHPSDFPNLLARYGVEMIAEKIETEGAVIDLLDFDVKFGQGFLFAPPRPVRGEVFQGGGERFPMPPLADVTTPRELAATPATPEPASDARPNDAQSPETQREISGLVKLARAFGRKV